MKLEEIYLSESDTKMLCDILEYHNKDLPYDSQKTFQECATDILREAIYYRWRTLKDRR